MEKIDFVFLCKKSVGIISRQKGKDDPVKIIADAKPQLEILQKYYDTLKEGDSDYSKVKERIDELNTAYEESSKLYNKDIDLKDKDKTCVKDIWDNAFKYSEKTITKKDSNDIVAIFDNYFKHDWEKVKSIRFDDYGIQRGWKRKPSLLKIIENEDEILPF